MQKKSKLLGTLSIIGIMTLAGCKSHYEAVSITPQRFEMTSAYDRIPNSIDPVFSPYKQKINQTMNTVIAQSDMSMTAHRPQSVLSNFVADVLYDATLHYDPLIDFSVMNIGGIRAGMPKGNVTIGNMFEISPFENIITIVELKGSDVTELFRNIASCGGEGISHHVRIEITKNGKLVSAQVGGKDIVPDRIYKIATIDYLAEGNDKLIALRNATNKTYPEGTLLRDLLIEHMKKMTSEGKRISSKIDERLIIVK